MGKKTNKAEKLGKRETLKLILAELQKLKGEIKALGKQQAALGARLGRASSGKKGGAAPAGKARKASPAAKTGARKSNPAPKRPVLVAPAVVPPTAAE
jgi:hypothetical protein